MTPSSKYGLSIVTKDPLNAETQAAAWLEEVTPRGDFYIRNHFGIPQISPSDWRLKVSAKGRELNEFTLEEIKSLPKVTHRVVLECAGNGRKSLDPQIKGTAWGFGAVAQAEFSGAPLWDLVKLMDTGNDCSEVVFVGADNGAVRTGEEVAYARSMSIEAAMDETVLLCWEMNGEALPVEHGFPLRLLVPGHYGMSSVKWLSEIHFLNEAFEGFFQTDDYVYVLAKGKEDGSLLGAMRVRSLYASHTDGQNIPTGKHTFRGIAWSGEGAIQEVVVSIDGGQSWKAARLDIESSPYAWVRWSLTEEIAQPGNYEVLCRASDTAGNQQPMQQYWNKGGYGNNIVQRVKLNATLAA